jgi:hypothetical protein
MDLASPRPPVSGESYESYPLGYSPKSVLGRVEIPTKRAGPKRMRPFRLALVSTGLLTKHPCEIGMGKQKLTIRELARG